LWGNILVKRDYIISANNYNIPEQSLRYEVGQPMGALSSWDMLNLTHHMMIQFIAQSLGKVSNGIWYDQYIILGDDLVFLIKILLHDINRSVNRLVSVLIYLNQ
jgi:hypothetical protein